MSEQRYLVPAERHRVEVEIEKSRFVTTLGHAPTPDAARRFIDDVRREFPDATHNCWAFAAGKPGDTLHVGMSDDGEPSGTAGRPMLTVLLHGGVGEIAAVVTRYYGGVKLGTGGLVRAYTGGVQQALASLPVKRFMAMMPLSVTVPYASVDVVLRLLPEFEAEVVRRDFGADAVFELRLPDDRVASFVEAMTERTAGRAQVREA